MGGRVMNKPLPPIPKRVISTPKPSTVEGLDEILREFKRDIVSSRILETRQKRFILDRINVVESKLTKNA